MLLIAQIILSILSAVLTIYAVWKKPIYFFYLLFLLLLLGQLARIPLPITDKGILISDVVLPLGIGLWYLQAVLYRRPLQTTTTGVSILLFIIIAGLSLVTNLTELPGGELLEAGFYLFRLVSYLLLYYMALDVLKEKNNRKAFLQGLLYATIGLALLGVLQFIFIPDFTFMAEYGWDPHIGRLLSTWYDPNYLAGFFALIISIYFSLWYFSSKKSSLQMLYLLIIGICFVLTLSRSGMLALGLMIGILGVVKMRTLLILVIIVSSLAVASNERLQERFLGLANGAIGYATGSLDHDIDITSLKRIESWEGSMSISAGKEILGVGYNSISYRKLSKGLVTDGNIHSASGSDSSLLNIYLTTGIIGFMIYFFIFLNILWKSMGLYLSQHTDATQKALGLGFFAGLLGIMAHSFFVNSLLLPFFLMVIMPFFALIELYRLESLDHQVDKHS